MNDYVVKGGAEKEQFPSGSVRDSQRGKPRYDLIPTGPLRRLAELYAKGAEKYGERNWEKGQPDDRIIASLLRHIYAYLDGVDPEEDHLAAVVFNAFALMYNQDKRKAESGVGEKGHTSESFVPFISVGSVLVNLRRAHYTMSTLSENTKQALGSFVEDSEGLTILTEEGVHVLRMLGVMEQEERKRLTNMWRFVYTALKGLFEDGHSPSMNFDEVEHLILDQDPKSYEGWCAVLKLCPALKVDEVNQKVSLKPMT